MSSCGVILASSNPLEHVVPHPLVEFPVDWGFLTPAGRLTVLSDQIVMLVTGGVLLMLFMPTLVRRRRGRDEIGSLVPVGFANAVEFTCEYLREQVARPALGEHTDRFVGYVWSAFFFVLTVNLLGLLPIPAISGVFGAHVGGTATGNIWVTGTMAVLTMAMMVVNGLRFGGKAYLAHFCPGPLWLAPLLIPVEIIGLIAKIFALAVRLFANMVAGHILLAVLLGFIITSMAAMNVGGAFVLAIPIVLGSVAITLLEVLVAFLQAFIFTFLTTLFIGMSVNVHHEEHRGDEEAHAH
jgi:F-type H+-transporting ATPase subunit a